MKLGSLFSFLGVVDTDRPTLYSQLSLNPVVRGHIGPPFPDDTTSIPSSGGSHQGKGAPTVVDVSKTNVEGNIEGGVTHQRFLLAADRLDAEHEEPTQDVTAALSITRPTNDAIMLVGNVVLAFETRGFTPSVETPIKVSSRWKRAPQRLSCILNSSLYRQ